MIMNMELSARARQRAGQACPNKKIRRQNYIDIKLDEEDLDSPFFMVFDHRIPRRKGDLVVTSMLMNAVKGDLSEEEFHLVMNELARHFEGKPFDRNVVKFECWKKW